MVGYDRRCLLDDLFDINDFQQLDRIARQNDLDASLEDVDAVFDLCFVFIVLVLKVAPDLVNTG